MNVILRAGRLEDAGACGAICFEAFKSIASEHNFPWDFPSAEIATGLLTMLLSNPGFYAVVERGMEASSAATFSTNAARLPASVRSPSIRPRKIRRSAAG